MDDAYYTDEELKDPELKAIADEAEELMRLTMSNLRKFIEFGVTEDEKVTTELILGEFCGDTSHEYQKRNHINKYLRRLTKEGKLVQVRRGVYRKPSTDKEIDLISDIKEAACPELKLPLELHDVLKVKRGQLIVVGGDPDAGKSSFLFETLKLNYDWIPVKHIISNEWSRETIIERLDELGVNRTHAHVKAVEMNPHFEDDIDGSERLYLIDYIRLAPGSSAFDIDDQLRKVVDRLGQGIAIVAVQAHSDTTNGYRLKGGDYAEMKPHHIIVLNKKEGYAKITKSKTGPQVLGMFREYHIKDAVFRSRYDVWASAAMSKKRQ